MIPAPAIHAAALVPLALPALGSLAVLLAEAYLSKRASEARLSSMSAGIAIFFLSLSFIVAAQHFVTGAQIVFDPASPMIRIDPFSSFAICLIGGASILACLLSIAYLMELHINHAEYYALILLATSGMMLMVAAVDLITVFLGLELMSIPIYVLAGFERRDLRSNESALKYLLIGSFASAILLYGMALIYGVTGQTDFAGIRAGLDATNPLALVGLGLITIGFAFKVSAVPFHQWTPDVYEGAPTVVTAYMSVTVKTTAFLALMRFVVEALGPAASTANLSGLFWGLAAITMIVGNLMGVIQVNVKRMLAYSSIAHAGYLLIGFATATPEAYTAVLFYLVVYVFMTLGAFSVMVALAHRGKDCDRFEEFAGLARSRPGLAALMTLFMIALAGIPPTGGFYAKFALFGAAVKAGNVGLTILAVLTSLVSVYYYLRLPVVMYMREAGTEAPRADTSLGELVVLATCAVAIVFLGLLPNSPELSAIRVFDWARTSVAMLF
ncbi:MAG TPA: NADH-quinone oxidoreductase subunit N [Myxococcota bacterium]|nr:NADH-quinone oxidoreductase subunit N [Myxococcota bacterium]